MSADTIPVLFCACGWKRPLIAVTLANGERPREAYRIRYDCPECGRAHACGEVPLGTAIESGRAHRLASAQVPTALDEAVMARLRAPFACEFIEGRDGDRGRWRIHDANDDAIASVSPLEEGYARMIVDALNARQVKR